jgi:hypothetical protein
MSARRSMVLLLSGATSFALICRAVPSFAQTAPPRDCRQLELAAGQIAKNDALRPSLAPRDPELADARAGVKAAQLELESKEEARVLQKAALDAAVANTKATEAELKAARDAFAEAVRARNSASTKLNAARETLACQEKAHYAARHFRHSVGVGLQGAQAADETARFAFALRYQYTRNSTQAWEASLEAGRFWLPSYDDDRDTLINAMYRWKFGSSSAAMVVGGGMGWLADRARPPWKHHDVALLGELGVEFRIRNHCGSLETCTNIWPDARAFVQPWVPLNHDYPVAILFGIQLGASVGFHRMSP